MVYTIINYGSSCDKGSYLADSASSHGEIVVNSFEISGSSCHCLAGGGLGSPSGTHKFDLLMFLVWLFMPLLCSLYKDCVSTQ